MEEPNLPIFIAMKSSSNVKYLNLVSTDTQMGNIYKCGLGSLEHPPLIWIAQFFLCVSHS